MDGRCGFVAIVGRPNVGKSTLVNALAGVKTSIVSRRRQTTRGVVRAVCERGGGQLILLDSPGWQTVRGDDFSRTLNGGAQWAAARADLVLFMTTEAEERKRKAADEDSVFLASLPKLPPVAAAVNKIDLVKNKRELLPAADRLSRLRDFAFIMPLSAKSGEGVEQLADEMLARLPESPALFSGGAAADQDFFFGELLREKLFRALNDELPYRIGVVARRQKNGGGALRVSAEIYVERDSQKAVVIGSGGAALKQLASAARRDMERAARQKIFLTVRVIVRPQWRRDVQLLARMRIGAPGDA
ncbi:MAG: GTPase Era [Betaproteobacteria bacterium]|nr:GTPase Era [Betaproteobacteria bacterium]